MEPRPINKDMHANVQKKSKIGQKNFLKEKKW